MAGFRHAVNFRRSAFLWHVAPRWHRLDVTLRDLPLALALFVVALLPALQAHGTQLGGLPHRSYDALALAAVALQCLPLTVRRRAPLVCVVLSTSGCALDQLRGYHSLGGTAMALALLSAGAHLERHRHATAFAFSLAYVAFALGLLRVGATAGVAAFVLYYVAMALVWGMGSWLRSTRCAEAEHRLRITEETRTAERAGIARELHDIVTHHVTAMVVQAEAARYLTATPERLDESLDSVTDTGRRAMTDLRHLLDLLNPDHVGASETPSRGRLSTLVAQARQRGQPVEFTEEGTPPAGTGSADPVAFRVVQEALTHARTYAPGSRTSVEVRHGVREITVQVRTDGTDAAAHSPGRSGGDLDGLRARVLLLGGEFAAEPRPTDDGSDGFVVRARIPSHGPS